MGARARFPSIHLPSRFVQPWGSVITGEGCKVKRKHLNVRCGLLLALSAVALGGCGGDEESTPASPAVEQPATPAPAAPAPAANKAPTISGTSPTAVNAGTAYSFTPTASDADGDTLAFSIQNKPSWATFFTATGKLSGTPAAGEVGTYANIGISVSDGKATTALAGFSVAVNAISNGRVTLSWMPPTENTDGSPLTDLSGYKIYYGTSAGALTNSITVATAGISSYIVEDLSPATWYFAITAVTASGEESTFSNVASQQI
jgi:hypothetical protein